MPAILGILLDWQPEAGMSILRPGGCTPGVKFTICSKKKCSLFITMDKALKSCPEVFLILDCMSKVPLKNISANGDRVHCQSHDDMPW
ncbi:hypothetical protein DUI87_25263 [Hirundo rustica rustica]|uniref:Uncharacterized protein n=1 Tax=Hirundo rustica rustica TaxID=333673 RepID=A0A3M0JB01_HIRRU|nr:hypothetical protein DUI87_25263 [Hirundo rustica rustica]